MSNYPMYRYIAIGALLGVIVIIGMLAALGYIGGKEPQTLKASTITVGLSTFDVVEKRPELFQDLGVRIEVVRYQVPPQSIDSLLKGETQLTVLPVELAGAIMLKNPNVYIVALDNMLNQAILVPPDSDLDYPGQLKGKKVAAVVGSGTFALFKSFMKTLYGLEVNPEGESDVQVVNVRPGDTLTALKRGDVDAAVIWDPIVSLAVAQGNAEILADYQDLWEEVFPHTPAPMLVWVARGEVVENAKLLKEVLEAHRRAASYWNENRDEIVEIFKELYNLPTDVAEEVWERNPMYTGECITGELKQAMIKVWELAREGGYLSDMPPADNILTCEDLNK